MPDGLTAAAHALRYWERRQEVIANNLANSDTAGFKAERVFGRLLAPGVTEPDAATDMRHGRLTPSGNALDLAMGGDGFFIVDTPNGERLSRGGACKLDAQGYLTDAAGNRLLGEKGPIPAVGGDVTIDSAGLVRVGGEPVDRLRVEVLPPNAQPQHDAGTLFVPDATRQSLPLEQRSVRQGFVEESNVDTIGTMVDMISVQRAYAAVQKAVTTIDAAHGIACTELGKV